MVLGAICVSLVVGACRKGLLEVARTMCLMLRCLGLLLQLCGRYRKTVPRLELTGSSLLLLVVRVGTSSVLVSIIVLPPVSRTCPLVCVVVSADLSLVVLMTVVMIALIVGLDVSVLRLVGFVSILAVILVRCSACVSLLTWVVLVTVIWVGWNLDVSVISCLML